MGDFLLPLGLKGLQIEIIKQGNTGHKTYLRQIPLNENYVHRLDIKYIKNIKYQILGLGKIQKAKKETVGH